jgi:hypothetical protein
LFKFNPKLALILDYLPALKIAINREIEYYGTQVLNVDEIAFLPRPTWANLSRYSALKLLNMILQGELEI